MWRHKWYKIKIPLKKAQREDVNFILYTVITELESQQERGSWIKIPLNVLIIKHSLNK